MVLVRAVRHPAEAVQVPYETYKFIPVPEFCVLTPRFLFGACS